MKSRFICLLSMILILLNTGAGVGEENGHVFGFICNGYDNELFASMRMTFETLAEEEGITFLAAEHHADANVFLEQAENMISAGVEVMFIQNFNIQGTEPLIRNWVDRGIKIISFDTISEAATVNVIYCNEECGYTMGTMMANWINNVLADQDEVQVYLHGHIYEGPSVRADYIEKALSDLCPRAVVVARRDVLGADEPEAFESALVQYPDIQVVCTINDSSCVNICEWWTPELVSDGADLSRYGCFSIDAVDTTLRLISDSRENRSIFRGTLDGHIGRYMGKATIKIWDTYMALINGEEVEDWYIEFEEVTGDNIAEYGY